MSEDSAAWPDPPPFVYRLEKTIGAESVNAFAKRAGMAESTLRSYVSGRSKPGMTQINKIAAAGGVSAEWLLTGMGPWKLDNDVKHGVSDQTETYSVRSPESAGRETLARGTEADPAWPMVAELVYDALLSKDTGAEMPNGRRFRELVTAVLVVLRLDENGDIRRDTARKKVSSIV
ncbi:hypothetical protein CEW87_04040 [Parazoarcus communis]|uniref:HTH cro/C1-type domain-containing protein n=2 Tax=Parazoarcus communis TaxID=41977 RepID=A0A2U8GYT3_9RHOO|nr:hypothetical protein CEW87_04040 [Parazoarcus communis]